jgi:DNA-binding transcriptional regulator YhcF (GntR family)
MIRDLRIDPTDAVPIWKQIEDGVRRLVASAAVEPGSAVPSVRDLARALRVNPATVAKAYQRLSDAGVLAVRRGEGTFVADAPPAMRAAARQQEIGAAAARFVAVARTIGASRDEAVSGVERAWDGMKRSSTGEGGRR